jgi:hypothetical protein
MLLAETRARFRGLHAEHRARHSIRWVVGPRSGRVFSGAMHRVIPPVRLAAWRGQGLAVVDASTVGGARSRQRSVLVGPASANSVDLLWRAVGESRVCGRLGRLFGRSGLARRDFGRLDHHRPEAVARTETEHQGNHEQSLLHPQIVSRVKEIRRNFTHTSETTVESRYS